VIPDNEPRKERRGSDPGLLLNHFLELYQSVMSSSTSDTNTLKRTSIKMAGTGADFPCTLYLTHDPSPCNTPC
jgi:hypothetical protein